MAKRYLLTYHVRNQDETYEWFDTEKELRDFIENEDYEHIYESIEIQSWRPIDIEA